MSDRNRKRFATAIALLLGSLALAAHGTVPGQISYQGLLLDSLGDPVNGTVDLDFRLFDAVTGGSQLWTESHTGVSVLDGVYDVLLGDTTPIAPSVVAGGALYLEIEVDTETLTPRQRLVAVPYALEAESANTVGGVGATFVSEAFEHFAFDGADPPNDDPSEGLGDTDGDGIANFVDSDNDNDGISDGSEVSNGSDINLVTPIVQSFSPFNTEASTTTTVTVNGGNFQAGQTVVFGSESPVPSNLTATSFDVSVGPQSVGSKSVTVTLPNGEQDTNTFGGFVEHTPSITSFDPVVADFNSTTVVTISGTDFFPGLQVAFGSENPTPTNLTSTSLDVSVGPQPQGTVSVVLSYPSGNQDSDTYDFVSLSGLRRVFVSAAQPAGNLGGLTGADALCQSYAAGASLPGTYMAWLSDGVDDPDSRFNQAGGPFVRVDLVTVVADDWADLTDGTVDNAINRTQTGGFSNGTPWTNVATDGTTDSTDPMTGSCNGWTSNAAVPTTGSVGLSSSTTSTWTDFTATGCNTSHALICVQQ